MAPKKSKKTADSINSRLALVMKSGKGALPAYHGVYAELLLIQTHSHSRLQVNPQDPPIWQG